MKKVIDLHSIPALQEVNIREDIKLLPLNNSHASSLLEILENDESIRTRVTVASRMHNTNDVEDEVNFYKKDTGLIRYALLSKDKVVGLVSLWRDDGFWGEKNLDDYGFGYFLDPNERGKGLVTDAVKSLMEVVLNNLHVNQFVAFSEDSNHGSKAILTRLGFEPTEETLVEPNNGWIERKFIHNASVPA